MFLNVLNFRLVIFISCRFGVHFTFSEIEFLKTEKKKQMLEFMDDLELTRTQLDASTKASTSKINHLQDALEERKAALNALRYE